MLICIKKPTYLPQCFVIFACALMAVSCSTVKKTASDEVAGSHTTIGYESKKGLHLRVDQQRLMDEAYTWLGTPYKFAGVEKGVGVDCSGMVTAVFLKALGWRLPRNSARQAEFCLDIKEKEIETGDLVFFATGKDPQRISHVGIIVDSENFIHASSSKGVTVSRLHNPYYTTRVRKYGRVPRQEKKAE